MDDRRSSSGRAKVVNQDRAFKTIAIGLGSVALLATPAGAIMGDRTPLPTPDSRLPTPHLAQNFTCPATLEPLTTAMLRDLPGYINRSTSRLVLRKTAPTYAIIASQPDFMPLPTDASEDQSLPDDNLHQIFFTVLERQYVGKGVVEFQQFHWLFLVRTTGGWRLALLFSQIGSYPVDRQPNTPPRESSQSATADAIRLWLRNCEAGSVKV
ncbi:MAG: hypothetical protein RBJ76_16015 [Stenomitos frigidus ULC029]